MGDLAAVVRGLSDGGATEILLLTGMEPGNDSASYGSQVQNM